MLSEKILVVDDNPRVIQSLKLGLEEYEIKDFNSGEAVLDYLRKPNLINLVMLDIMMPGIDGLTTLQEIKKINKDIAVIMMTGFSSKDVAIEALRLHADDYVEKPFNIIEVREQIRNLLKEKLTDEKLEGNKEKYVDRIKRFIRRNHQNVTLDSLAVQMCLSPKYISRMFNEENGLSFRNFKLQIKMDEAKALLKKSHLNINEIAIKLGYQNPESFMRLFKRLNQLTPSEYRKKNR